MTPDVFFPDSPTEKWNAHRSVLVPDFLDADTNICEVAVRTWVLRSERKTILIDTGVAATLGMRREQPWPASPSGDRRAR
jgi:hypothetical protein